MPAMHISRSITIDKPVSDIRKIVGDFHHWPQWSPWLIAEPDAAIDIREDGKYYSWSGNRVGNGEMTILNESDDGVDYDLAFLKPWKSKAKTSFTFNEKGESTEVTWIMNSSLSWFMFWMKKQMEAYIGNDYERGLAMLKEYTEEGKVHSKLDFIGKQAYPGSQYIALKSETTIGQMPAQMEKEFTKMMSYIADKRDIVNGKTFTIYHKWDMVKQRVSYTSGIPMKSIPLDMPNEMFVGSMPDMKVYTVRHTGKWSHLGNAWSTLYSMQHNKEIKCARNVYPFETYINSPRDVGPTEMISDINFPLKR